MRVHWLQHVPFEALGSIETWLEATGATVTVTRLYDDEPLPDVAGLDLVIAMGGPMSVNDEAQLPWLVGELRFIREAIDRGVAVLGVCLGAQLIAKATGARVYKNAEREIGWFPVIGTSEESDVPNWARKGVTSSVFHWHGETFDLPKDAVSLARSPGCEHQAFRIGRSVIGIQFHLETTPALVHAMTTHCADDLAPGTFVQTEAELRAADASAYANIHGLMEETLDYLCQRASRSVPAGRQ